MTAILTFVATGLAGYEVYKRRQERIEPVFMAFITGFLLILAIKETLS